MHLEEAGASWAFLGAPIEFFCLNFVGMERATQQLQPLATPAMLHFFLTQDSTSSSLGPAAHQLSLNPEEPPMGLENKKSARPRSREKIPKAIHLAQRQNT